jgi:hypothetical protein
MVNAVLYYIFSRSNFATRYQLFLVVIAVFIIPLIFINAGKQETAGNKRITLISRAFSLLILLTVLFFGEFNGYKTITDIPRSTTNIYEQQYQTGQFVKKYCNGQNIAVNDIGTPGFFGDGRITDLWGLADLEVLRMRRAGYTKNDLLHLAGTRNIKAAFIYESWLGETGANVIPDSWVKVGQWQITDNIVCGSDKLSIYAVDIYGKDELIKNLKQFSSELPPGVKQSGLYTENNISKIIN